MTEADKVLEGLNKFTDQLEKNIPESVEETQEKANTEAGIMDLLIRDLKQNGIRTKDYKIDITINSLIGNSYTYVVDEETMTISAVFN